MYIILNQKWFVFQVPYIYQYLWISFDIYRGLLELVGIIVGHLYFFLMFKYPQDFGGARLLSVPNIL